MVVPACWSVLQAFLNTVTELLSVPQSHLLQQMLLAWLMDCGGKMCRASRLVAGRHRTSLARFLNKAKWDAPTLLTTLVIRFLQRLKPRPGETIDFILDDTRFAKRARQMPALQKIWIHAEQRFARGHTVVVAAIVFRGLTLPWQFVLWLPADYCKIHRGMYRKTTTIAAELIRQFEPPTGLKVRVLFDAFYLCPAVTKACTDRGFTWFSVAARNRNLTVGKRSRRIGEIGPGVLRSRGDRVRLKRSRGWRWMKIAAVDGRLSRIGEVRVVFSKRPQDPWKNVLAVVTNATTLPPREIVASYERRWAIEVLFKELKGSLGLGEYQVQTRQGIERHLHLCGLAHLTLTHHGVKSVGAEAKRANKDVPLPKFQERLESLRHEVRTESLEKIIRQVRQVKVRKRLREALLAKE
jgi:SRSO17 transposase